MITRLNSRTAAGLMALALIALATASIRMDSVSQENVAPPAVAGLDIPALTAAAGAGYLPVLSLHDPI